MKSILYLVTGCVVSCLLASLTFARDDAIEVLLGMLAPLGLTTATLVLVERTYKHDPRHVTKLMIKTFIVKMVFIAAYIVFVIGLLSVEAEPFAISFTVYFISVYLFELMACRHIFGMASSQ